MPGPTKKTTARKEFLIKIRCDTKTLEAYRKIGPKLARTIIEEEAARLQPTKHKDGNQRRLTK